MALNVEQMDGIIHHWNIRKNKVLTDLKNMGVSDTNVALVDDELDSIFKELMSPECHINTCSCDPVPKYDSNGNGIVASPWCWKCDAWRNFK